jgi:hypothetical protein
MVSNLKSETARANGAKSRETGLFNAEILTQASPDLGSAFRKLADDSRSLALANRYESRLQRVYDRAYKTLRELQLARKSEPPAAAHQPGSTAPSVSEGESAESNLFAGQKLPNEPTAAAIKEVRSQPDPVAQAFVPVPKPRAALNPKSIALQ